MTRGVNKIQKNPLKIYYAIANYIRGKLIDRILYDLKFEIPTVLRLVPDSIWVSPLGFGHNLFILL